MNQTELKIGMTLYCKDGSTVILQWIEKDTIIVQYKGKNYSRSITAIGDTLFCAPVDIGKQSENVLEKPKKAIKSETKSATDPNKQTYNALGYDRAGYDRQGFDMSGYDRAGFDKDGFNKAGYNRNGYNRAGYDRHGFDKTGFDIDGYDKNGYDRTGYGRDGFDRFGYNRRGFDRKGYDKSGRDRKGYDRNGYDKFGYDAEGYDRNGYNKDGFDRDGYGADGYNQYDLNRKMEHRPGSEMARKLKLNETKLYHEIWGEGIPIKLEQKDRNILLYVRFETDTIRFSYPKCFSEGVLLFEKSQKLSDCENFLTTPYGKKAFEQEKAHLAETMATIQSDVRQANAALRDADASMKYLDDDAWTPQLVEKLHSEISRSDREQTRMLRIQSEPYFARVDKRDSSMYIGKHIGEKDYLSIVDWADSRASIYYEYQMYVGNSEQFLSLVRDLTINSGILYSIFDKYNVNNTGLESKTDGANDIITDTHLLMIINAERHSKAIHDIIATIQQNQYKIITNPVNKEMVVCGCAGSGKTMILLHRLRYLLRNHQELLPESVYALSPTVALTMESSQLANTLGMQNINVTSNVLLYSRILERFEKQDEWGTFDHKRTYLPNDTIDGHVAHQLYVEQLQHLYQDVYQVLNDASTRQNYILTTKKSIRQRKIDFLGLAYSENEEKALFQNLKKAFDLFIEAKQCAHKFSIENINHMQIRARQDPTYSKALDLLCKHTSLLSTKTKLVSTGRHVYVDYKQKKAFKPLKDFLETIQWYTDDSYCGIEDPIDMFENIYKPISELQDRILSFESGHDYACIFDILDYAIAKQKQKLQIDSTLPLECDLFAQVFVLSKMASVTFDDVKLFFVDEFQDYSMDELMTIKRLFPQATFNYFGDYHQSIVAKGVCAVDMEQYASQNGLALYNINENYRNAKEITEYVNNKFNVNMRPVGIDGTVQNIKYEDLQKLAIAPDDRAVLICAHTVLDDIYQHLAEKLQIKCQLISTNQDAMQRGTLNLVSVAMAKGLEFEKVILFSKGMTPNEEYVASTRALASLYILNEN